MKNEIIQNLRELDKFKEIIEQIETKKTPINISGLVFVGKSHMISTIKEDINNPLHKAREMYKILKDNNAKSVHVFINKEGVDFDFKYDKKDLMYGCTSSYMSIFNMPASERKNYANLFGKNNDLTYKDIYKIEYKSKPLYIDNSLLNLSKDDEGYSIWVNYQNIKNTYLII